MKVDHRKHVIKEKQLKMSWRNAQRNLNIIRIKHKKILVAIDYGNDFLSRFKVGNLAISLSTTSNIKRKVKKYYIIIGDWFFDMPTYQDCIIIHELGHIIHGDLASYERNHELNVARLVHEPSEDNIATQSEMKADEYIIEVTGDPQHVYDWLCEMHRCVNNAENLTEYDKYGLRELEFRIEHINDKYLK